MVPASPSIRNYRSFRNVIYRVADLFALLIGMVIAGQIGQALDGEQFFVVYMAGVVLYLFSCEVWAAYRQWRGSALRAEIAIVWSAWGTAMVLLVILGAAFQYGSGLTRGSFGIWGGTSAALLAMMRSTIRTICSLLWSREINTRGFAVVGVTDLGIRLARGIADSPELGLRLSGFFDDRPLGRTVALPSEFGACQGTIADLVQKTRAGEVSAIYITFPMRAEKRIRGVLDQLADSTASVYVVPDFFVFELLHSRWNNIQGIPVVSIFENPFYGIDGLLKRLFDVVLGSALLLLAAIPMMLVAIAVKCSSPGPVFFRQKRYGLDGKEIPVWKFRTMRVCEDGAVVTQAQQHDPRVTPVGAFLRKTSLDELPQLFNVILGNMSLVGPRPHASAHNEKDRGQIHGYMLRHKVKPGITGLAQVEGWRGETDTLDKMAKRIECDHQYIREWNLWLDFKILFRTVFVVFSAKNAY